MITFRDFDMCTIRQIRPKLRGVAQRVFAASDRKCWHSDSVEHVWRYKFSAMAQKVNQCVQIVSGCTGQSVQRDMRWAASRRIGLQRVYQRGCIYGGEKPVAGSDHIQFAHPFGL